MNPVEKAALAKRIYDFFRSQYQAVPEPANLAFVFGCNDPSMAIAAISLLDQGLVEQILVTGGVGKDSGNLTMPEADFLAGLMYEHGVPQSKVHVESLANNGAENTRRGMKLVLERKLPHKSTILVAPATRLIRLYTTHTQIARDELGITDVVYQLHAPEYELREGDQETVIFEFGRLITFPKKGWADQLDLPPDLVESYMSLS